MSETYLTAAEVSQRFRGEITPGTLASWRSQQKGPPYRKIGGKVLYPLSALEAWEKKQDHKGGRKNAK